MCVCVNAIHVYGICAQVCRYASLCKCTSLWEYIEARGGHQLTAALSLSALFSWAKASHWTWLVASSTPAILSPLPIAQRAKAQEPCAACYTGVGSLNSGPHAFLASSLACQDMCSAQHWFLIWQPLVFRKWIKLQLGINILSKVLKHIETSLCAG